MQLIRSLPPWPDQVRGGVVSIGNFDGVHRGHAVLVAELVARARQVRGPAVVFTFDPHPAYLLHPDSAPQPLTTTERKAELLKALGVDVVIAYPTDTQLLGLGPREFFQTIVCDQLEAHGMVEGPNFCFGRNREGDIGLLTALCQAGGRTLTVVEPWRREGEMVSSTVIRGCLQRGEVARAAQDLTAPYRLAGVVAHGAGRGSQFGFPTANLTEISTLLPAPGVYAGLVEIDGRSWPAAINLGPNPTFGEGAVKVEVHIIGFAGTLYGQVLAVDFLERLRDIRTFPTVEELWQQLGRDVAAARRIATNARTD